MKDQGNAEAHLGHVTFGQIWRDRGKCRIHPIRKGAFPTLVLNTEGVRFVSPGLIRYAKLPWVWSSQQHPPTLKTSDTQGVGRRRARYFVERFQRSIEAPRMLTQRGLASLTGRWADERNAFCVFCLRQSRSGVTPSKTADLYVWVA